MPNLPAFSAGVLNGAEPYSHGSRAILGLSIADFVICVNEKCFDIVVQFIGGNRRLVAAVIPDKAISRSLGTEEPVVI